MYSIPRRSLQISKPPKLPVAKATLPIIRNSKCPESVRARIMSIDAVMPYVDGERGARARLEQLKIAELFGVQKAAISKHLKNIYSTGELSREATVSKMETVQNEGGRMVVREQEF